MKELVYVEDLGLASEVGDRTGMVRFRVSGSKDLQGSRLARVVARKLNVEQRSRTKPRTLNSVNCTAQTPKSESNLPS